MSATRRRVCGLVGMAVASYRYRSQRSDEPLRAQLVELAREKPRFGYRRLHILLGRAGEHVNHKRVHRVYRAAGLMIRRKKRKHCVREHGENSGVGGAIAHFSKSARSGAPPFLIGQS
jgi:putative transposase